MATFLKASPFLFFVKLIVCAVVFCIPLKGAAQEYFPFFSGDTTKVFALAMEQSSSMKNALQVPDGVKANYRTHYKKVVEENALSAFYRIRNAALLDTVLNPYIQKIYQQIVEKNRQFPPL